jgi:hypothetical protein
VKSATVRDCGFAGSVLVAAVRTPRIDDRITEH